MLDSQTKPELLSDEALAEIEARKPFQYGTMVSLPVAQRDALCQTVRALRAQLQTKATLVISDIAKENAALRKLIAALEYGGQEFRRIAEGEITRLREQLAEAQNMNDTANRYQARARARIDDLESRLAQVEKERDDLRDEVWKAAIQIAKEEAFERRLAHTVYERLIEAAANSVPKDSEGEGVAGDGPTKS